MSLEGKTALVTGAATGIGAAIAKGLASQGATVFGADIAWGKSQEPLTGVEPIDCDVADSGSVQRMVSKIEKISGGVDILVNNAALATELTPTPFERISPEEWVRVMSVNTLAPFLCSQAVVENMRKKNWGRIVNLTSATIFLGTPNNLHYIASKGAIATMTRSLANELGAGNITVNAVAPGLTVTEGIERNPSYSKEMRTYVANLRAIKREQCADDLVGSCLFLVSEDASFMTGQILTVDGGSAFH
jgi:NAD(P)-dependent dehydrogenase (short-subunit alcohol dehydrogenase family)